ncbi:VF530 family DNA-binding protein [Patiriisocius sp. Uisw_047]|jgi:SAM-dependent methyltransferase|uniref:VF530 family DNA-binding protein n=1 Tax=Patiriisocius sp. Uisw_047 TaxID=3230969 RepID=UPI0039E8F4EC
MNEQEYWQNKYEEDSTGWDLGVISSPLKAYIDQLTDKNIRILIPGAGNGYEAEYLWNQGFKNVFVVDIAKSPLENLKKRIPDLPEEQLIEQDFFKHKELYDLILEQTFFCSFPPVKMNRTKYATKMTSLLQETGKLVGVWFDFPLIDDTEKRPFGGSLREYRTYFQPYFEIKVFERCHNSNADRMDKELFAIMQKKKPVVKQNNNPLHGITLKAILEELILQEGWENMANACRINSFYNNPTLKSSLTFLRKTPWAREKVEQYYLRVRNKK